MKRIFLVAVFLLIQLPFIQYLPFITDENVYVLMILDQIEHPSLFPTMLDVPVGWKPPLFFWVYAFFVQFLDKLNLSFELTYRLPTLLFGLINIFLFQKLMNRFVDEKSAFWMTLAYIFIPLNIYVNNTVLLDTFMQTTILGGILFYLRNDKIGFLGGAILSFIGYMLKMVVVSVVPVVVIAYFFFNNRKTLSNPLFLLSLLAIPFAAILYFFSFPTLEMAIDEYSIDILGKVIKGDIVYYVVHIAGSIYGNFPFLLFWPASALYGIYKYWKKYPFMVVWFSLIVFPMVSGFFIPWHYVPIIPPIIFFSFLVIKGKEGIDLPFKLFFTFYIILNLFPALYGLYFIDHENQFEQKEMGKEIAGKNIIILNKNYFPKIFTYKVLIEEREGSRVPFGYVLLKSHNLSKELVYSYVYDYENAPGTYRLDGIYILPETIKLKTNSTDFDHFLIVVGERQQAEFYYGRIDELDSVIVKIPGLE
ncbi:glycosyltransferase family 39 protein [Candidatus Micrarchaeota archaeon]|nr:glycosyltransferase family 39 protein [Candidatus Micrarchaeota archaeon]